MTPEVKKRIEQIRQGIVPEGYKKTESGIIPNEWRVGQVSKCIEEYKFFSNDISHIPVYSSSRKGLVPQSDYYNQREAVETNLGYKVVPQGYVTYRHMSDDDVFHFNINKTGENVLVSSEYPVFTSSDNCDLSFLISVLNNTARFRYFCKMQKLGGTRTRLYLDNLKRYALALPPFDEQQKIAEILATQDKTIELQARKIEELKRFKKGCLEKMFPRKGQKVPEKRFPGFTDDWERRKLGSIYEAIGNAFVGTATPYYVENGHFYLESNNIKDGQINHNTEVFINDEFYEKQKDKWLHTGDMVMVQSGHVGHAAVIPEELDNSAAHALIMFRHPKIEIEPYFLNYQYQTLKSKKKIENITTGNTIKHILASDMQQFEVDMPKLEERKKIAEYFRGLDRLIALHQCKLEEMKRQKKALMQLLLMGIVRVKA